MLVILWQVGSHEKDPVLEALAAAADDDVFPGCLIMGTEEDGMIIGIRSVPFGIASAT